MLSVRIVVCGGRNFYYVRSIDKVLSKYFIHVSRDILIHGGARGADKIAYDWAMERGFPTAAINANWIYYGNAAGPIRNAAMLLLNPELVIAFEGGEGTANMIDTATKAGIEVHRYDKDGNLVFFRFS